MTAIEIENLIRAAGEKYRSDMLQLFPIGSYWLCTHRTKGEYWVEVLGISTEWGIYVRNIHSGAKKYVHWASLKKGGTDDCD